MGLFCADNIEYRASGEGLSSVARVTDDGRILVSLDLKRKLPDLTTTYAKDVNEFAVDDRKWSDVPRINIVVMIVGSRGMTPPPSGHIKLTDTQISR